MKPDDVIALRAEWACMNYAKDLPEATVLATPDWVTYVRAMADALPRGEVISAPSEEDVLWGWPDGVAIVFPTPISVEHAIISTTVGDVATPTAPHHEQQIVRALWVLGGVYVQASGDAQVLAQAPDLLVHPYLWIGEDETDLITGHWVPGHLTVAQGLKEISESTRLFISIITALGHRLTRLDEAGTRPERKRVGRAMSGPFRVLQLANRSSGRSDGTPSKVDWQKRWFVHEHWRMQPCGPNRSQRKAIWIDTFIKGPEDKPLDDRPTLWKTPHNPEG